MTSVIGMRNASCLFGPVRKPMMRYPNIKFPSAIWAMLAVAVVMVGTWAVVACNRVAPARPASSAKSLHPADGDPVVEVLTARVRRGTITQHVSAPGSLVAKRESHIGTEVAGRVLHVFVSEGDRVEAGAPLFQIDPLPYEMALRQAEAGLDVARAERQQMDADLARAQALRRQAVVSQQDLDRLTTGLAVAQARERQAREAVALARHNVERTTVRAPYAASIARRLVDEGTTALVQPQTIIVVLQEVDELEARATIPESRLALVRAGDPALIHVQGLPAPIQTTIDAVGDAVDPATRTYTVRMRVPNPEHTLKAGLFAEIEILPRSKRDALVLPRAAIRSEGGRSHVFVVRDGVATSVDVGLGIVEEDQVEVLSGVRVDTPVVVGEAAQKLASGMKVRVAESAGGAP